MNLAIRDHRTKNISLFSLFIISVVACMLFFMFYRSDSLLQSDVFSKASLSLIKRQNGNMDSLFILVCRERLWVIPLLFLLSTTYLAKSMVYITVIRYGTGIGALLAAALMRYGIGGIFLLIAAGMPQFLLYVPTMVIALRLSSEKRSPDKRFVMQLVLLEVVVIIGCILETYVNVIFLEKILKLFL